MIAIVDYGAGGETPFRVMGSLQRVNPVNIMVPRPPGQSRMVYEGTSDKIGMIPYLSAILGAREIEAWGRPPLNSKQENKLRKPEPFD